jgi:hypothetical protein
VKWVNRFTVAVVAAGRSVTLQLDCAVAAIIMLVTHVVPHLPPPSPPLKNNTRLLSTGKIEPFSIAAARECEIVLMAVDNKFATKFGKEIGGGPKRTVVIDNSSAFRQVKLSKAIYMGVSWI